MYSLYAYIHIKSKYIVLLFVVLIFAGYTRRITRQKRIVIGLTILF